MPLRDHFHPPLSTRHSWQGVHGQWPAMIVLQLFGRLPDGFSAEPRVNLGRYFEIDVAGFEAESGEPREQSGGGVEVALWASPAPTATLDSP